MTKFKGPVRALANSVSMVAIMMLLAACGTSSRGAYLGGTMAGAASSARAENTEGETDVASEDAMDRVGHGGSGGGSGKEWPIKTSTDGGPPTGGPGGPTGPTGPVRPTGPNGAPRDPGILTETTEGVTGLTGGILHTVGNAVLVTPDMIAPTPVVGGVVAPIVKAVGETVKGLGDGLSTDSLGAIPVVGGAVAQTVAKVDTTLNNTATVNVGGQTLTGNGGTTPVAVSVASATTSQGSVATVGALSGGQTAVVALGQPTTGTTAVATNGAANGLLGGQVGGNALTPTTAPLVGVNVGSAGQTQGSLVTVGVASGGQPLSVAVGDVTGALTGGALSTGGVLPAVGALLTPSTPAANPLAPVLAPVAGVGGGDVLAGLSTPVNQVVTPVVAQVVAPVVNQVVAPVVALVVAPLVNQVVAPVVAPVVAVVTTPVVQTVAGLTGGLVGGLTGGVVAGAGAGVTTPVGGAGVGGLFGGRIGVLGH